MKEILHFKDLGFKIAVINILMYELEILKPKVDVYKFIEAKRGLKEGTGYRALEIEGDPYEIVPEVFAYFKQLEITAEMVADIEEIYMDGGDEIYAQIIPLWDGECDTFNIKSAEDAKLLPKLKRVTIFFDKEQLLKEFEALGISAEWT